MITGCHSTALIKDARLDVGRTVIVLISTFKNALSSIPAWASMESNRQRDHIHFQERFLQHSGMGLRESTSHFCPFFRHNPTTAETDPPGQSAPKPQLRAIRILMDFKVRCPNVALPLLGCWEVSFVWAVAGARWGAPSHPGAAQLSTLGKRERGSFRLGH